MKIEQSRFLVIGGSGFIGSHIVDQLLRLGASYVGIYDNLSSGSLNNLAHCLSDPRVHVFAESSDILHMDLLHDAMKGIDGVFHLAGLWLLHSHQYPRSAFEVNVRGTMNVVETAIANRVKRLVFSSSASVYGESITQPINENAPLSCLDFYGASKVCGEYIIKSMYHKASSIEHGLKYNILRYMNVYGPRQRYDSRYSGVVASMTNAALLGHELTVFGDGTQSYDFIDARDCATANCLAMTSDACNDVYNIGTGRKTSVNELAKLIIEHCPLALRNPNIRHIENSRPYVTTRFGCTEKARILLGFTHAIELEEGIRSYLADRSAKFIQVN